MRCFQLVSGLESRLGMFEERIDGSISELQAKVTLIEGRLKFVERAPVAGGVASASVLSAASAPASPMKEPDTTYGSPHRNFACLFALGSYVWSLCLRRACGRERCHLPNQMHCVGLHKALGM